MARERQILAAGLDAEWRTTVFKHLLTCGGLDNQVQMRIHQGEGLARPSRINVRQKADSAPDLDLLDVGGAAVIVGQEAFKLTDAKRSATNSWTMDAVSPPPLPTPPLGA